MEANDGPTRLPLAILLAALCAVFVFGGDRGTFYRMHHSSDAGGQWSIHNVNSAINLALAANLSPEHGLRLFFRRSADAEGKPRYKVYSRFPLGGYVLIKLAILPWQDFATQIWAARMLMLLLFCAAAVVAYHAIARLLGDGWWALAAVAASFSSYYLLYFNDSVDNEGSPDLFAVLLAFHGMVVYVQERRLRQLLLKTAVAVLLGWHVFGLLAAFIGLGLAREWIDGRKAAASGAWSPWSLARSPLLGLGVFAVAVGVLALAFNLVNEYVAVGGAVADLPSLKSALYRTGFGYSGAAAASVAPWPVFLEMQLHRVTTALLPYWLSAQVLNQGLFSALLPHPFALLPHSLVKGLVLAAGVAGLLAVVLPVLRRRAGPDRRGRWLLLVLALSGVCHALLVYRNTAVPFHTHESLFYVGIPLALWSLAMPALRELGGERLAALVAVASAAGLALSAFWMGAIDDPRVAALQRTIMRDMQALREALPGGNVCVVGDHATATFGAPNALDYYLAGKQITWASGLSDVGQPKVCGDPAGSALGTKRNEDARLLTPRNEVVFLHAPFDIAASLRSDVRSVVAGEPVVRSRFDVYVDAGRLHLVRAPCAEEHLEAPFFVRLEEQASEPNEAAAQAVAHSSPRRPFALAAFRQPWRPNVAILDFASSGGVAVDDACLLSIDLPRPLPASLEVGQRSGGRDVSLLPAGNLAWAVKLEADGRGNYRPSTR